MTTTHQQAVPVEHVGRFRLAESPRWQGGLWWWVDMQSGAVVAADPATSRWSVQRWDLECDRVSFVVPLKTRHHADCVMIAARGTELVRLMAAPDWRSIPIGHVEVPAGFVLNDAVADGDGHLWVGLVDTRGSGTGSLVRIDRRGVEDRRIDGFTMSNGLGFAADGSLLHVDTGTGTVWRHRVRADGSVGSSEPLLQIPPDEGVPDGLCTDLDGGFWLAVHGAGQVRHHTSDGTVDRVVTVPTAQTTSVALGGSDGLDLLITTGQEGLTAEQSAADPLAGLVFAARADSPGATWRTT